MTRSRKRSEGEPMPLVGRVWNLLRGLAARWVGRREQRHPDAVYVAAIGERVTQYAKLREAAAGIIYLRSKLAKELERESADLGRVRRQLEIAVERDDDAVALHLIGRRDTGEPRPRRHGAREAPRAHPRGRGGERRARAARRAEAQPARAARAHGAARGGPRALNGSTARGMGPAREHPPARRARREESEP